jgi:fermentation-respiration switch protein FrsA (DUF1100 family)
VRRGARAALAAVAVLFGVVAGAATCSRGVATPDELRAYHDIGGGLATAGLDSAPMRGRYHVDRVRLTGRTGLSTGGWMYRPATSGCYPAVLLQDGREENADVIGRLPAEFGDVVVLSLDYPEAMPDVLQLRDALASRTIARAARQIPALFSLGAEYLASRSDVDTTRIALAATSFAVPFAAIAGAFDTRFANIALIYGAGDMPRVLAANLALEPAWLRGPVAWLALRPFAEFAPERFIGHIAPRPVVMVNGSDDPQMPAAAAQALYDAAREPKSIAWLRTGHLSPTDSALIRQLVDTAFARMPVLHETGVAGACRGAAVPVDSAGA